MAEKLKVLLASEWSGLGTGYGNIYKAMGEAFVKEGFNVTEYASYCFKDNLNRFASDWPVIPAGPDRSNKEEMARYNSNFNFQFGGLYFNDVIASVKPDIVIDWRDPWYSTFIACSPARKYFNFIYIPTIDSRPARPDWIEQFAKADVLNSYTYFGKETIEKECGLKHHAVTAPGVENSFFEMYEKFRGQNKETFRKKFGLPEKSFILSFVSRNQRRKLFGDVIYCIDELIRNTKEEIPIYVHFHTSYPEKPEASWELPLFLARVKHPERFLFTYICARCKYVFCRTFADNIINCPHCQGPSQMPGPSTDFADRETLKEIMYAADIGIQISMGEGFGLGQNEHKSLGNPVLMTQWSAMQEQGTQSDGSLPPYKFENGDLPYLGGQCVAPGYLWIEIESSQFRCYPDRQDFINKVKNWYNLWLHNKDSWSNLQSDAYRCADTTYRWKKTTDKLISQIYELGSTQSRYLAPKQLLPIDQIMKNINGLPPEKRTDYFYAVISPYVVILPSIIAKIKADISNISTYGFTTLGKASVSVRSLEDANNFFAAHLESINEFEEKRCR